MTAVLQRLPRASQILARSPVVDAVLGDPGSPRVGAEAPDVTIVVFTDYQCPICKATDPALERLIARDARVRVIFKDWPIFGAQSQSAARVALAADRQGQYLAVHRALMAARTRLNDDQIRDIASGAGIDGSRLDEDLTDHGPEFDKQLGRHAAEAWSMGLQGTPAYLVGPYLIQGGLDDRRLAQAVSRARKSGPL